MKPNSEAYVGNSPLHQREYLPVTGVTRERERERGVSKSENAISANFKVWLLLQMGMTDQKKHMGVGGEHQRRRHLCP